jgi:hypothetical protein
MERRIPFVCVLLLCIDCSPRSYADLKPTHEVYIKLFAKDHFQTTLIGECTITAEELCNVKGNSVEGWYPLIISKNFKWKTPSRIFVKLSYNKV